MTKTIRIKEDDAKILEQAVRVLAAELQQEIKLSDLLHELTKEVESAKERIKTRIIKVSQK
jgi:hypothetical protein